MDAGNLALAVDFKGVATNEIQVPRSSGPTQGDPSLAHNNLVRQQWEAVSQVKDRLLGKLLRMIGT
ncbi:MAG: hypothetical protein NVSMB9_00730 [Isosphaeraceae bacterium]